MDNEMFETGTKGTMGTPRFVSHTHAGTYGDDSLLGLSEDSDLEYVPDGETMMDGSEPLRPLPNFMQLSPWPTLIQQVVDKGRTPAERDVLLLGLLNVIGATLGPKVRTLYNGKWLSPCMMLFVVAPPASGKSVLAWLRHIVQPFHDELRRRYEAEMKAYKAEKVKFDSLGKAKGTDPNVPVPELPVRRFFIIPGNNSGTGMAVNLINSGGRGIIFETEADTLSAALNTDYGHFGDILRNTFDQERISLYRRTNDEGYEQETTYLNIVLSGTPGQVKPLVKSAEDGLASRFIWYYMPAVKAWQNQFERKEDMTQWFITLGREWKRWMDALKTVSFFTFRLTDVQEDMFNFFMEPIFVRARNAVGEEAVSIAIRLAHHLLRSMSVVALLRVLESTNADEKAGLSDNVRLTTCFLDNPLIRPEEDVPVENVHDGICPRYEYGIGDADFSQCLIMGDILFRHAMHILSLLPAVEVTNRGSATKDLVFSSMGERFTRTEFLAKAGEQCVSENTALQWIKRALKKGQILKVDRGVYAFVHTFQ